MDVSSSVASEWNTTMSSSRLRNSGLKWRCTTDSTASLRCRSSSVRSAIACEPRFEVRIRIVLRKSTVRPWPSVSRPSSSTCSSTSKTSGWAFSTSSSSTTRVRPPAHRLGELAALLVADVAGRGADQPGHRVLLARTRSCRCGPSPARRRTGTRPAPWPARSCRHRSGRGTGTSRSAGPGRRCRPGPGAPRRTTARTASAWPTTRAPSASSIRSSLAVSPSSSRPAGMPVHAETTSAMSSGPTSSLSIAPLGCSSAAPRRPPRAPSPAPGSGRSAARRRAPGRRRARPARPRRAAARAAP